MRLPQSRWPRILIAAVYLAGASALSACSGDDPAAPSCDANIGHEYESAATDITFVLTHDCASGSVTGTLYDSNSFAYALTGSVSGDQFSFEARRPRPSGTGADTFRSQSAFEVLSGGLILRGKLTLNGVGGNTLYSFARVEE